jgi:predicted ester cyclase
MAIINRADWTALEGLLDPAFRRHSLAAGSPGVESAQEFINFLKAERTTYPDATESILLSFASGNMVAARHEFRGTQTGALGSHAATNRTVRSVYIALYRVEQGRLMEAWAEWDNLADLRQLGHAGVAGELLQRRAFMACAGTFRTGQRSS